MTDASAPTAERCRKLVRHSTVPRRTAAAPRGTVPGDVGDCPQEWWGQSLGKVVPGEGDEWLKLRWLREGRDYGKIPDK